MLLKYFKHLLNISVHLSTFKKKILFGIIIFKDSTLYIYTYEI